NNRIRQTKDIIYEDGKFKIIVDEQGVTYPGIVTNQLVINDEGRVSTCLFYFIVGTSLDREILQSIDKVEVLEQLDEYVLQAFENLREFEERIEAGDATIRKLNDDMIAAETNRENAEADRGSTFDNLVTRMNNVINVAITTDETLNNNETARINNFNTLKTELEQIREGLLNLNNSISLDEQNRVQAELDRANASIEAINRLNTINTNITNEEATRVQEWNNIKSENTTLKEALTTINNTANSNEEVRKKKEEERIAAEQQRQANFETMQQENNSFKERIDAQYEHIDTKVKDVDKRVQAIEENGVGGGNANIDDTTISKISTWSSKKIEDFVHTNDDVVWSAVQGENLSIEYTKEGYLREVEIWGNTWQDDTDSVNIIHSFIGNYNLDTTSGYTMVDNNCICTDFIEIVPTESYYVHGTRGVNVCAYDKNKNFISGKQTISYLNHPTDVSASNFTLPSNAKYIKVSIRDVNTPYQIVKGTNPLPYEPYHKADLSNIQHLGELYVDESGQPILDGEGREQYKIEIESRNFYNEEELLTITPKTHKTTILLPCQLCKAGDVADRLFWDNEKGKYVVEKNLNQTVTFNGSEDWTLNWGSSDNYIGFNLEGYNSDFKSYSMNYLNNKILTKTEYLSLTTKDFEWISLHSSRIAFKVAKNRLSTSDLEGIKAWVKDLYVIYELDTPQLIETTILEEIKQPTYKDLTHLFVTGGLDGTIKAKSPLDGGQAIQTLSAKNVALNEEVITLSLENEEIKEVNNTQDILIDTTMMATDEVYTMLEPILEMMPMTMSIDGEMKGGSSKMVDMYVAMVQRGLKTIEQVPARYREEVREILAKLEK
ncbi:hypothetical protein LPC13_15615, partial [Clostridium celatum]|uniref:CD1375 family protein n=1 Tax=Clostridium celatum TaxID=36834 RepID=UPI001F3667AF